jgi:predicted Holliday junction resolvase-like endonuclease
MSISIILFGIGAIILLGALAKMFSAYNAPKVEAENTKQEVENTLQKREQTQQRKDHQEHRERVIDKKLTWREKMMQWRRGRRGQPAQAKVESKS